VLEELERHYFGSVCAIGGGDMRRRERKGLGRRFESGRRGSFFVEGALALGAKVYRAEAGLLG
jgi:hypothetical protein